MANPAFRGVAISDANDLLEGTHLPEGERAGSAEAAMWAAVVARAWSDAFIVTNSWIMNTQRGCDPEIVRAEARRWLLLDFGAWRDDREAVCLAANVSPEKVREAALARMRLAKVEDAARRETERAAIDRAFETLMDREAAGTAGPEIVIRTMQHLAMRERFLPPEPSDRRGPENLL